MSYTPTTWATGDVITEEKLNNIESGILNAPGVAVFEFEVITNNNNQVVTDVTIEDVMDASNAGKLCVASLASHSSAMPADANPKIFVLFDSVHGTYAYATATYLVIGQSSETTGGIASYTLIGNSDGWSYEKKNLSFTLA